MIKVYDTTKKQYYPFADYKHSLTDENLYGRKRAITTALVNVITDLDGNVYTPVTIGTQQWIVQNFRCTKYADGSAILNLTEAGDWIANTAGAYCAYDNDADNIPDYGLLYNWFAVSNAKGLVYLVKNNVQDVGWRIGSDEDWTVLTDYIGGESVAGGLLKATGTDYWDSPNTDATDIYGFSARGHGIRRVEDAVYAGLKKEGTFWTTTVYGETSAYRRMFLENSGAINIGFNNKNNGFAVRLVRDI
jgi:uncharacterized protein (TIGR02145 family)